MPDVGHTLKRCFKLRKLLFYHTLPPLFHVHELTCAHTHARAHIGFFFLVFAEDVYTRIPPDIPRNIKQIYKMHIRKDIRCGVMVGELV